MTDYQKQIQAWQNKVQEQFQDSTELLSYLKLTLENFFYRYLETSESKDLKVSELSSGIYGAVSYESDLMKALNTQSSDIKSGIKQMAKEVSMSLKPKIKYQLSIEIKDLTPNHGELNVLALIDWDFPHYQDPDKKLQKIINWKYHDLAAFRKNLALKLEEVCEIFN